jgi:alkyl sulfatase BDS1-like metallo-beta-lactamase superfamily hydrolase
MDGPEAIMLKAQEDFDAGNYRWVAEVLNHVVMDNPEQVAARALLADTLEQLGYQSESGPWRNFYLCGVLELREGLPAGSNYAASAGMAGSIPLANVYQIMAVRLNADRADGITLKINLAFYDSEQTLLSIENSVLNAFSGRQSNDAAATLKISQLNFKLLMAGQKDASSLMTNGELEIDGDAGALLLLSGLFDQFERRFPIVTPRKPWR